MAMSCRTLLRFPVTLRTQQHCFLVYLVLREVLSYAIHWGTGPALSSDPAYLAILIPGLFCPSRGC